MPVKKPIVKVEVGECSGKSYVATEPHPNIEFEEVIIKGIKHYRTKSNKAKRKTQ